LILLKERNAAMLKNDLIVRNPLRLLGTSGDAILNPGAFGAVLAHAGAGKTALIVQIALDTMLQEKKVLHISLNEPVGKVSVWYQEVFGLLAQQYRISKVDDIWDEIIRQRFIMTFRAEGFAVPRLEERLTDLTAQNIFLPDLIIIDGMPFGSSARDELQALKALAVRQKLPIWFTVTTHRHEPPAEDGLSPQFHPVQDLFDVAITLQPAGDIIHIKAVKGAGAGQSESPLVLDPATMLIQSRI
jgi:hypothetical protein